MSHHLFKLLGVVLLLAGCTSANLYATGRNAQRTECMKEPDQVVRERCLKDASMSRDTYQKEVESARK